MPRAVHRTDCTACSSRLIDRRHCRRTHRPPPQLAPRLHRSRAERCVPDSSPPLWQMQSGSASPAPGSPRVKLLRQRGRAAQAVRPRGRGLRRVQRRHRRGHARGAGRGAARAQGGVVEGAGRTRTEGEGGGGYDGFSDATDGGTLEELGAALPEPKVVWVMVPAGDPTEDTINSLGTLLRDGDLVIEGGNSNWRDSVRRGEALGDLGVGYVDAGTSGGVWGLTEGYCLMVGGEPDDVALAQPIFDALAPEGGFVHTGAVGTGHFTKMVHNGIEYGLMQAYAEGYELLARSGLDIDAKGALSAWREGSVVRS